MSNKYRSVYCGKVEQSHINNEIKLAGWIANIRDHGGVVFVDLRDETGIVQLVSNDDTMFNDKSDTDFYIIPIDTEIESLKLANNLRSLNYKVEMEINLGLATI